MGEVDTRIDDVVEEVLKCHNTSFQINAFKVFEISVLLKTK